MQKPPSSRITGTPSRKFSRHYHRTTENKSEITSKGRRIVELELKRKRNLRILIVALSVLLGGSLVVLYAFETGRL